MIQDWLNSDYQLVLFLDSLDEGSLNIRTISASLVDLVRRWPRKRLEIRFACRTSDWPKLLDKELPLLFHLSEVPKYELLPLRKVDVEVAATVEGMDWGPLIKAVRDAEAAAFANRPATWKYLELPILNLFSI